MHLKLLLGVVAVLVIAEGLFVFFNPRGAKRLMILLGRDLRKLKFLGLVEFLIGVLLLLISIFFGSS
jgi:uncharacterized protein YjeT (DUF2065 family)